MTEEGSLNLSCDFRIRESSDLWAQTRSIHIRLGIDSSDIRDFQLEDFIREAMVDVQSDLDLYGVSYTSWTSYGLVPNGIRIAVMYGAIEILLARKLESWKARLSPSVGPVRVEVIERDASKAIQYFAKKKETAIEKYADARVGTSGRIMSTSTDDEEPIFDIGDLEDKAMTRGADETSWFKWLLGR